MGRSGEENGWNLSTGGACKRRYLVFNQGRGGECDDHCPLGTALTLVRNRLLYQPCFRRFLQLILGPGLQIDCDDNTRTNNGEIRRFRKGRDYSLAISEPTSSSPSSSSGSTTTNAPRYHLDVAYMVAEESGKARDHWDSEDAGGYESYHEKERSDQADAEVYVGDQQVEQEGEGGGGEQQDNGPLLNVSPRLNGLSLVLRDKRTLSFVKFVSRDAPSSRVDIRMSLPLISPSS